jgi:NADH-quinone oxidoreductase subunit A
MSIAHSQPLLDIAFFTGIGILFIISVLIFSRLLSPRIATIEKNKSYESGENAEGATWPAISTGYFVIALLFLLFEIEIIMLIPLALNFTKGSENPDMGALLIAIILFVLILSFGLIYAWIHGYLNWFSPAQKISAFRSIVPESHYESFNTRIKNEKRSIQ